MRLPPQTLFFFVSSERWRSRRILFVVVVVALMVIHKSEFVHGRGEEEEDDMRPRVAPMIPSECNSALSMISGNDEYSIFKNAIHETGMDSVYGSVRLRATVFIPTNKAIVDTIQSMSMGEDVETRMFKDFDTLHALVRHHVIPYYSMAVGDMQIGSCYETMAQGQCIRIGSDDGEMVVLSSGNNNNATIDMADLNQGCPTVFHTITGFLIPDIL